MIERVPPKFNISLTLIRHPLIHRQYLSSLYAFAACFSL